uniref:Uncharacterized protein n=2 Tax=Amphimedon queenslandica TaxID=400682 RepID=A0A1X7TIQ2_AMPQE
MVAYSFDFKHLFSNLGQSYLFMVCFVNAFSGKLCCLKSYVSSKKGMNMKPMKLNCLLFLVLTLFRRNIDFYEVFL